MNDEFEGLELRRILPELLSTSNNVTDYNLLMNAVNQLSDVFLLDKYLFSGTQLRDDISQWRAYTTLGKGICFKFNDEFILDKTITKTSCIYDFQTKKEFIENHTNFTTYTNKQFSLKKRQNGSVSELVNHLLLAMECFKHESFSSEKEIRWIDDLNSKGNLDVNYRSHRLGLLPYRSIPIDLSKISEIILGPQVPKQNIATLYKLFCNKNKVKIISSMVTLK